ncbi:MAG: hypothetical protein U0797_09030 [Gemmataceae bacterium]
MHWVKASSVWAQGPVLQQRWQRHRFRNWYGNINSIGFGGDGESDTFEGGNWEDDFCSRQDNDVMFGFGGNDWLFGEGGWDEAVRRRRQHDHLNGGDDGWVDQLAGGPGYNWYQQDWRRSATAGG